MAHRVYLPAMCVVLAHVQRGQGSDVPIREGEIEIMGRNSCIQLAAVLARTPHPRPGAPVQQGPCLQHQQLSTQLTGPFTRHLQVAC